MPPRPDDLLLVALEAIRAATEAASRAAEVARGAEEDARAAREQVDVLRADHSALAAEVAHLRGQLEESRRGVLAVLLEGARGLPPWGKAAIGIILAVGLVGALAPQALPFLSGVTHAAAPAPAAP